MPPRTYSDLQLACAVAESKNMRETLTRLGLAPRGGNYENVRRHITILGLSTDHFVRRGVATSVYRIDDGTLREALAKSTSKAAALRYLGLEDSTSNIRALGRTAVRMGWSTSHHVGQGWRRGCTSPVRPSRPLTEVLVAGRPYQPRRLKERLIAEGLKEGRCENCRAARWFGRPLTLELHHVNGDREDNRLENLQLLCANCHSLTDTYRGRNIGRMARPP